MPTPTAPAVRPARASSARSTRPVLVAALIDAAAVLLFVLLGRRSHGEDQAAGDVVRVVAPFLIGAATGWLVTLGWKRPQAVLPTGVGVWVGTAAIGLTLRRVAFDGGVELSFVIVASSFLGLFLVGWRVVATLVRRRGTHARPEITADAGR